MRVCLAMTSIASHVFAANLQDLDVHDPVHVEFWDAMVMVAEHELGEARRQVRRADHPSVSCAGTDSLPVGTLALIATGACVRAHARWR